ncbi:MAG: hypothetical protein MUF33_12625 [Candidatus Nanopelagicales bacterium]|nr:hypothetical protein [Candidatus Nanopelagicales bacterium]
MDAELKDLRHLDDEFVTVGELLTATQENYDRIDGQQREALEDIFDALNNNEQPLFDDAVIA